MTNEYARKMVTGKMVNALSLMKALRDHGDEWPNNVYREMVRGLTVSALRIRCIIVAPVRPLPLP